MKRKGMYLPFLIQNSCLVLMAIILNGASGCFRSIGAVYLQKITDIFESSTDVAMVKLIFLGAFFQAFSYVLRWGGAIIPRYMGEKYAFFSRVKLMEHLQKIPYITYENQNIGNLQSVIRNDTVSAGEWIYGVFSRIMTNVCLFISSLCIMLYTNATVTIVLMVCVFGSVLVNQRILKRITEEYEEARQKMGEMTHILEKIFSGLETVKSYHAEEWVKNSFLQKVKAYCVCIRKAIGFSVFSNVWCTLLAKLCLYVPMIYLGIQGIQGVLSIGEVIMFVYLVREIITPIEGIFRWMSLLSQFRASSKRIEKILNLPEQVENGVVPESEINKIQVRNLSFSYNHKWPILNEVKFDLLKNQITLLAGDSGTGKTTLMKILLGLYESSEAQYVLDGKVYTSLSGQITYSSLNNSVFSLSIYENMALGDKKITKDDCREMLGCLGFQEWIDSLPEGIETEITSERLSGGQKQAISVGRALLSGKNIILLDEPFSALDEEKYLKFQEELERRKKECIILVTSHRETKNKKWNQVIQLDAMS